MLWGGGEILKDYTNKLGLVYWFGKMLLVRAVNKNLVGGVPGHRPDHRRGQQAPDPRHRRPVQRVRRP
ncbi:hypothetical protein Q9Q99_06055 [Curtobacterium flaccumfaciens]|nr:hypothetical protein Q9Q99_06055 [Curtobacterium flaccumfaciens]